METQQKMSLNSDLKLTLYVNFELSNSNSCFFELLYSNYLKFLIKINNLSNQ
jgi:hypothetical protein